jgi:hypothetical protein
MNNSQFPILAVAISQKHNSSSSNTKIASSPLMAVLAETCCWLYKEQMKLFACFDRTRPDRTGRLVFLTGTAVNVKRIKHVGQNRSRWALPVNNATSTTTFSKCFLPKFLHTFLVSFPLTTSQFSGFRWSHDT